MPHKPLGVATPECEKLKQARPLINKMLELLEWLGDGSYNADVGPIELAYYPFITSEPVYKPAKGSDVFPAIDHYRDLPRSEWKRQSRLESVTYQPEALLFKFFGIDPKKLEDERRALLDEQRRLNDA